MTRRLTKDIIEEIRISVIAATNLPARRKAIELASVEAAKSWLMSKQPPGFNDLARCHPKDWFPSVSQLYAPDENPVAVMTAVDLEPCSPAYVYFHDPVPACTGSGRLDAQGWPAFDKCMADAKAWCVDYVTIWDGLSAVFNSVRTVEKLLERMPELAAHIPKESAPAYALVAPSNLLSDLTRCGMKVEATA